MAVKLETISLMIGHAPDAAMLAWLSGQVEVGFSYIREFYIGNGSQAQHKSNNHGEYH